MSVCVSTLLIFLNILSHTVILFGRHLILWLAVLGWLLWRLGLLSLLSVNLGVNHRLCILWRVLFLAWHSNWGINLIRHTSSVDTLVLGHDLLESLIVKVATTLLLGRFVNRTSSWSSSCVRCLKSLSLCISRARHLWLHLKLILLLWKSQDYFVNDLMSWLRIASWSCGILLLWRCRLTLLLFMLDIASMTLVMICCTTLSHHLSAWVDWSMPLLIIAHLTV